ncbi:MAG: cyclic lactone autoinducer peptide [Firmicutes bacterium]|nr:cyclic lactone autoinducer peptide [Bacillota bacterium]
MRKALAALVLAFLAILAAANVASACFFCLYQPAVPDKE